MSLDDEIQKAVKRRQDRAREEKRRLKEQFEEDVEAIDGSPQVVAVLRDLEERVESLENHLGI